jgi:murein DD-endopeptidase MepM/ murein hydrolase activator NlpD
VLEIILSIFLVSNVFSGVGKTKYETLIELLKEESTIIVTFGEYKEELMRIEEAVSIAKGERFDIFKRRDKTIVRINGFKRILKKRNLHISKLVTAMYKISRSSWGKPFIYLGGVTIPVDGRYSLKLIIKRALQEKNLIFADLQKLERRKKLLNTTLEKYKSLVEQLVLRRTGILTSIARKEFALKTILTKREKYAKTLYDAKAWEYWAKIVTIRKKYSRKKVPFRSLRGVLSKPAPGVYLINRTKSKGVYISTLPDISVRSPEEGTVRFTGKVDGYGTVVVVEHRESYYSLIGFVTQVSVKVDQKVIKGKILGKTSTLGKATRVPVYYELRKGTNYLDPKMWLRR